MCPSVRSVLVLTVLLIGLPVAAGAVDVGPQILEFPPPPPSGLAVATLNDCDSNAAVRIAAGGAPFICRGRLNAGGVILYWNPYYPPSNCPLCRIAGYRLHDARSGALIADVPGEGRSALLVPGAKLGDCYVLRAYGRSRESDNSNRRCVTTVHTTHQLVLGPSEVAEFHALIHGKHDKDWCSRDSWDKAWVGEPWGAIAGTHQIKSDPKTVGGLYGQFGYHAMVHPGTNPFPCAEGMIHVVRRSLTFTLPSEARQHRLSAIFGARFSVVGDPGRCVDVWRPRSWFYRGVEGVSAQEWRLSFNGRILSVGDQAGRMAISGRQPGSLDLPQASLDLSGDESLQNYGQTTLAFALSQGDYFDDNAIAKMTEGTTIASKTEDIMCAVIDPHLDVTYVSTQSIPEPVFPQDRLGAPAMPVHPGGPLPPTDPTQRLQAPTMRPLKP